MNFKVLGQYLDNYNKARGLSIEIANNEIYIITPPQNPYLNDIKLLKTHILNDIEIVKDSFEKTDMKSKYVIYNTIKKQEEIKGLFLKDGYIYIPLKTTINNQFEDLPIEEVIEDPITIDTNSILDIYNRTFKLKTALEGHALFNNFKKKEKYIIAPIKEVIEQFGEEGIENLSKLTKLKVPSEKIKQSLLQIVNLRPYKVDNQDMKLLYQENMMTNVRDFVQKPSELIFTNFKSFETYILNKYNVEDNYFISPNYIYHTKEPYFMKFDQKIYIIQNTKTYTDAVYTAFTYKNNRINIGYHNAVKKNTILNIPHIIIKENGERVDVRNNTTDNKSPLTIIEYHNGKYACMLHINEC